jgi:hypothetical protein
MSGRKKRGTLSEIFTPLLLIPLYLQVVCISVFWFLFYFLFLLSMFLIMVFLIHLSVPQQKNGFDCGLYVCRYAYGIFKLREQVTSITNLIHTSEHFQFNQQVINQFRTQLGKLLDKLSNVYLHGTLVNKKQHKVDKIEVHSPGKGVKRKRISSPRKATKRKQILNTSSKSDYVTFVTDQQPKHDDISILTDDLLRPVFTKAEKQSTDIDVTTEVKEVHRTFSMNLKKMSNVDKAVLQKNDNSTEMQSKGANAQIKMNTANVKVVTKADTGVGNIKDMEAKTESSNVKFTPRTPRRTFAATVKQFFSPMWSPFKAQPVEDQLITKVDHLLVNENKSFMKVEEPADLAPLSYYQKQVQPH